MILIQAIRNAMVNDLVVRNVADVAAVPALRWPEVDLEARGVAPIGLLTYWRICK